MSKLLLVLSFIFIVLPISCQQHEDHAAHEHHKIVATRPKVMDVSVTQEYVGQIRSQKHINLRVLEMGYIEEIRIREGQTVAKGDLLYKIVPTLYKAKWDAELAEVKLAQLELNNTKKLFEDKVVSDREVALFEAKLARAQAKARLAEAELKFTEVRAPFDGIVDRLNEQLGSLVKEGDVLTTLSDNSTMWVYFNMPEAQYLAYMAERDEANGGPIVTQKSSNVSKDSDSQEVLNAEKKNKDKDNNNNVDDDDNKHPNKHGAVPGKSDEKRTADVIPVAVNQPRNTESATVVKLVLANGKLFPQTGCIGAIEADFNNETGNISFRADFPNPKRLLRNGQTGNVLLKRTLPGALVIPQRATFEVLDKRFVFVIDSHGTVHQREVTIGHEADDIFVIAKGITADDSIVLDGVRQVHDGEHVEFEFRKPNEAVDHQKHHAE